MNERIQHLEEKVAYLERHVTEQDKAMMELADELTGMRRELKTLRERPDARAGGTGEERDDERPPHY